MERPESNYFFARYFRRASGDRVLSDVARWPETVALLTRRVIGFRV